MRTPFFAHHCRSPFAVRRSSLPSQPFPALIILPYSSTPHTSCLTLFPLPPFSLTPRPNHPTLLLHPIPHTGRLCQFQPLSSSACEFFQVLWSDLIVRKTPFLPRDKRYRSISRPGHCSVPICLPPFLEVVHTLWKGLVQTGSDHERTRCSFRRLGIYTFLFLSYLMFIFLFILICFLNLLPFFAVFFPSCTMLACLLIC